MASIRCKACGKTYDSREGFCPKCGAYNRPPRREWVDAGGDVHYAEQEKVSRRSATKRRFAMKTRPAAPGPISAALLLVKAHPLPRPSSPWPWP